MTLSPIQRALLIALVVALSVAALLALGIVLFDDLGPTSGRVLATTVALAGFSVTGMAAAVPPKGRPIGALAAAGLGASGVAFALCSYFIWGSPSFDTDTLTLAKVLAIAIIVSIACAHAALLLRGRGRGDATDLVVTGTLLCTAAISTLLTFMIVAEWYGDGSGRVLSALGILAVLGTMLTPLLPHILGAPRPAGSE